jgi:hypothetical protein
MAMEPVATQDDYLISIPTIFWRLPSVGSSVDEQLAEIIAGVELDTDASNRLFHALRSVTRVAHERPSATKTDWALVRSPQSGRVEALLSLEILRRTEGGQERYRAAVQAEAQVVAGVELMKRDVSERDLPAGPAIIVHDFVLPITDGGVADPAVERSVVTLFAVDFDKVLEFTLVTQDLGLFDDAAEYLVQIASQVRASKVKGE